ncbi:hypothetical protein [Desertivirga arenae]|uniref:hypothetical protein n=1 Tax=Desertivirga arenae TaxID=2810309 RepID=UPI001A96E9FC|nr:hypothetical protein [Pedobacter sp. SYSU D00823]
MTTTISNYRKQLIKIYFCLDCAICNLFSMGFSIGLNEEWQDFKPAFDAGVDVEMDFAYLEAIKHPAVPDVIKIIHILLEVSETLVNMNKLTDEELVFPKELISEEGDDDDEEDDNEDVDYLDRWLQGIFTDLLSVYEAIWILAHGNNPPMSEYDEFGAKYYDGGLKIDSEDENVKVLMQALNKVLALNGAINYFPSE